MLNGIVKGMIITIAVNEKILKGNLCFNTKFSNSTRIFKESSLLAINPIAIPISTAQKIAIVSI
jgi:hypothetical protein